MPVMMGACRRARGARGFVLALLLAACGAGVSEKSSGSWSWDYSHSEIDLQCYSPSAAQQLEDVDIPPFNHTKLQSEYSYSGLTMVQTLLSLAGCPLPRGSLADALAALKYPVAELEELAIWNPGRDHPLRAEHFAGLHLRKLAINYAYPDKPHLNPDVFSSLADLPELKLQYVILSPMPTTSRLRTVELELGQSTGAWGGCAELRELTLSIWEVPTADEGDDEGWLAHCPQLSTVVVDGMSASSVERVLRGARALTSLEISRTVDLSAMQLDSLLSGLPLQQLTIKYYMFQLMSENTLTTSLEKLTLTWAYWKDEKDKQTAVRRLRRLPALRDLTISDGSDFCTLFPENGSLPTLQRLTLSGTERNELCFSGWDSLEYLELFDNTGFAVLELAQLPPARAHPLLLNLNYPQPWKPREHNITLDEADYNLLKDRFSETANVTILGDIRLDCDCEHAWDARALRTLPLSVPGARCEDFGGASLADVPVERLECERFWCGGCECRRAWRDNSSEATCGSWVWNAPRVSGLRALHAAGSGIDTLHADDLPDTLLTLDLTNGSISRLDEAAVAALFNVSERVMWLAGNPLLCDNKLMAALQRHCAQVRDYKDVFCKDGNTEYMYMPALVTPCSGNSIIPTYRTELLLVVIVGFVTTNVFLICP